jgi:hypothetical protein
MKQRLRIETMRTHRTILRFAFLWLGILPVLTAQPAQVKDWALSNFPLRLEFEVSNPSALSVNTVAVVPVSLAAQVAPQFPGSLAIGVMTGPANKIVPVQIDSNGEFVMPVQLAPGETRTVHIYYSTTLHDVIPWPKRVHASHAFGYNRATIALESETIGYRSYGGFFLDIQARRDGAPGLYNSLVGYFGSRNPNEAGMDVIHLGDTLGLGGLFLRSGNDVYRPPVNMPDYAHKPEVPMAPQYRVIADGPVRASVEARIPRWKIGDDEVDLRAVYSIYGGSGSVECRYEIKPMNVARTFEVGAGIRRLPQMRTDHAKGRLALSGTQTMQIGPIALGLFYDPAEAVESAPLATKDDKNECVVFHQRLAPGHAAMGRYWVAGAWSGSGIGDLLSYLRAEEPKARSQVRVSGFRVSKTPMPERIEGEAY